jgi:hypothetical protein
VTDVWSNLWSRLEASFAEVQAAVIAAAPSVSPVSGKFTTDVFPLRAYVTFNAHKTGDEEIVISVDCIQQEGMVRCSADIACGTGEVLATLPDVMGTADRSLIARWSEDVHQFIVDHTPMITDRLRGTQG